MVVCVCIKSFHGSWMKCRVGQSSRWEVIKESWLLGGWQTGGLVFWVVFQRRGKGV